LHERSTENMNEEELMNHHRAIKLLEKGINFP
jgi:hypothetical protein